MTTYRFCEQVILSQLDIESGRDRNRKEAARQNLARAMMDHFRQHPKCHVHWKEVERPAAEAVAEFEQLGKILAESVGFMVIADLSYED